MLVNSEFVCYLAFNSVKRGFLAAHKRLEPLKYGLKDQRSIDWGTGARIAACHIVSYFQFERSRKVFRFLNFSALRDSLCVTLVVSDFLCFAASSFLKKLYFSPHKGLESLTVGLKVERSTDWASGARKEARHIVSCCPCEQSPKFFGVLHFRRYSWFCLDHGSLLRISMLSCFQFCEKRIFGLTQKTRTLEVWFKRPTLYWLS